MKKITILTTTGLLLLAASCGKGDIQISKQLDKEVTITPDYKDVTIPQNIAPMNFQTSLENPTCVVIEGKGTQLTVHAKDGVFQIPESDWKKLLADNAGGDLKMTVCEEQGGNWQAYQPFTMHVAAEKADPYVAYRKLQSRYEQFYRLGIYQRNIETYEESPIYENKLTDYNCVNCHSFPMQNPEKMQFHMRAKFAGTVLMRDGHVEKLNTKTDDTMSALVYPYWHPSEKYIAYSVNLTAQNFFHHQDNILEVYDNNSDVVIYDVEKHEVFANEAIKNDSVWESFPTFSPDGKSLYFLSAQGQKQMPQEYKSVKYSLCRVDFDPATRTIGTRIDTLYNADKEGKSVSFPRISPDGKLMVVGLQEFGNFSAWHKDCDMYAIRLDSGEMYPLTEANSSESDSYHSWSSNSRWMVFSSRRLDGLYTRLFMTYIDENGQAHKPFLLPQKNPVEFYDNLLEAYNVPEFIKGKVKLDKHEVASIMRESQGIDIRYKK